MSSNAQAIFYFIAMLGCLIAALGAYSTSPAPRPWFGPHWGWLGLASFIFVFFWIAVKAS